MQEEKARKSEPPRCFFLAASFFFLFNSTKEEWRARSEEQRKFEPLLWLRDRDANPPYTDVSWNNELMLSFQIEKVLS